MRYGVLREGFQTLFSPILGPKRTPFNREFFITRRLGQFAVRLWMFILCILLKWLPGVVLVLVFGPKYSVESPPCMPARFSRSLSKKTPAIWLCEELPSANDVTRTAEEESSAHFARRWADQPWARSHCAVAAAEDGDHSDHEVQSGWLAELPKQELNSNGYIEL